jgi:hypothetical protein
VPTRQSAFSAAFSGKIALILCQIYHARIFVADQQRSEPETRFAGLEIMEYPANWQG